MILGCDVSHWNGLGNWQIAKERGVRFAYIRAGSINAVTAVCYEDTLLSEHIRDVSAAGIPFGVYWYMRPRFSGSVQGEYLHNLIRTGVGDNQFHCLPVCIDVEESGSSSTQAAESIEDMLGMLSFYQYRTMIYARQSHYDANVAPSPIIAKCDLWAARWSSALTSPWSDGKHQFRDWSDFRLWQHSADGNALATTYGFPGHPFGDNDLDLNYFNGDEAAFNTWVGIIPASSEPPTAQHVTVTVPASSYLNVRNGPGAGFSDVGDLKAGVRFSILAHSGVWVRIGDNAWICTGPNLAVIE